MAYIKNGLDGVIHVYGLGKNKDIVITVSPSHKNFSAHIKKKDENISVNGRYTNIDHWGISITFDEQSKIVSIHSDGLADRVRLVHRTVFIDNGEPEYTWWEYIGNDEARIINATLLLEDRKESI